MMISRELVPSFLLGKWPRISSRDLALTNDPDTWELSASQVFRSKIKSSSSWELDQQVLVSPSK